MRPHVQPIACREKKMEDIPRMGTGMETEHNQ
jgi:hypothetical protein